MLVLDRGRDNVDPSKNNFVNEHLFIDGSSVKICCICEDVNFYCS